jgi:peroxiredoxin
MNATQSQSALAEPAQRGRPSRAFVVATALSMAVAIGATPVWKLVAGGGVTKVKRQPGQVVPDFALRDVRTGQPHRLSDHQARAVVIVFCGTRWQLAGTYLPRLSLFSADGEMRKVDYIAVNANTNESDDDVTAQARTLHVRFPMLKDPDSRVADLLSAEMQGEALVIDDHGKLRYRGAIDDQFNSEPPLEKPTQNYLLDAVDAVLRGKAVSRELTRVEGRAIERIVE